MDRRASRAEPPALRMMWASPRAMPKAEDGSMRASMQVTGVFLVRGWMGGGCQGVEMRTDEIFPRWWQGEVAGFEGSGVLFVALC